LTDEERARIEDEERTRLEIRERLEAEKKEAGKAGKQETSAATAVLGCIGLLIVLIVVFSGLSSRLPETPRSQAPMAELMAEKFVRKLLIAPASADFSDTHATPLGADRYAVMGIVDSQNAFGAKLRSDWTCTVRKVGPSEWRREEPCGLLPR